MTDDLDEYIRERSKRDPELPALMAANAKRVRFTYKNHRGEVRERLVEPFRVFYGATSWHSTQWILTALDVEKNAWRHFALKDISNWRPA